MVPPCTVDRTANVHPVDKWSALALLRMPNYCIALNRTVLLGFLLPVNCPKSMSSSTDKWAEKAWDSIGRVLRSKGPDELLLWIGRHVGQLPKDRLVQLRVIAHDVVATWDRCVLCT